MIRDGKRVIALAGQPNCGKSTVFNMLTGARQHVANYPGVTVDIKTGAYSSDGKKFELVDLPGTYSLTSYSDEERIARNFILQENPDLVVNVVDSSNLKRNLYLTFQLLEMGVPALVDLNMVDVAKGRGLVIDSDALSKRLGVPVVTTVGNRRRGKKDMKEAVSEAAAEGNRVDFRIDYGPLEAVISDVEKKLEGHVSEDVRYSLRWLALKLLEDDAAACEILKRDFPGHEEILTFIAEKQDKFDEEQEESVKNFIGWRRHQMAEDIEKTCVKAQKRISATLSDRIDKVVVNRFFGPLILLGIIYVLYELSIVQGYELTNYMVPWLTRFKNFVDGLLPIAGFLNEPLVRSLVSSVVLSLNSVLIYIPIFLILFSLIAILEDVGYMPRMAFILDRLFRKFGLHGQSTLPLILGGVFVGGCAVPGVMATRVIADEKARLATILIVPLMNCMAKIPLYTLLISIYFAGGVSMTMLFISTITIIVALSVAKVLSLTVLRNKASAPFVMEMPTYHLPTVYGVISRAVERTWLFFRKVITIIMLVAVAVFFLTNYPSLPEERMAHYQSRADEVKANFYGKIKDTKYYGLLRDSGRLDEFIAYQHAFKEARMAGTPLRAREAKFKARDAEFYPFVAKEFRRDKEVKTVTRAYKKMRKARSGILRELHGETTNNSYLGRAGKFLEPVTRYAGFNWRINVALLSALAAKENSVATLGAIYRPKDDENGGTLSERMKEQETGFTPLHALALMVFMALYPPCVATLLMVKVETGSWKWMLFALFYPIVLGLGCASLIFTGGSALGLTGTQAMAAFYVLAIAVAAILGHIRPEAEFEEDSLTENVNLDKKKINEGRCAG